MRAVLIGLGGIGSHLAEPLCRTLVFSKKEQAPKRILLIDGDTYEEKNRERQRCNVLVNKADATREALGPLFPELRLEAKPRFVDKENIFLFIRKGDAVFLAVDNHATRNLVSSHVGTLTDVLLISGGNETYDGNIQVYERRNGKDVSPPLSFLHPEIESPKDKNPADLACGELVAQGNVQLLTTNLTIASLMLNAYVRWLERGELPYTEMYFDLLTGNVRPVKRI